MKILIIATSYQPPNFMQELAAGQRYRLEYLELCDHLNASYMDYEPRWMHNKRFIRKIEEKIHMDFFWAWKIAKIAEEQNYDLIYTMSERTAVPLGIFLNRRIKHIATFINSQNPKWRLAVSLSGVHWRWDKIVTYSEAEALALVRTYDLDPEKITSIHNYVDLEFFKPLKEKSSPTGNSFIISQGLADRDYPTLIKAMRKLPHIECHINAVSAWDDFSAGYEGMKIPKNVLSKDYNHPSLIKEKLSECQFLVIPLRHNDCMWCAGSTSVLQAQAMGTPVIVSKLPGISEYVRDHETGFLVEPNNPSALAEKIDYLWKNPDMVTEMGLKGKAWVRKNFSLERWIRDISTIIEEVSQG